MTPLERAEQAYVKAQGASSAEAWEHAANLLYKVRRRARNVRGGCKGRYPAPVAVATFANGRKISMSFWSQQGKPLDWKRAARVCISGYRCQYRIDTRIVIPAWPDPDWYIPQINRLPLKQTPALVSIYEKTTSETWTPT